MSFELRELQEIVYQCNLDLFRQGLVIYTFGNVSAMDRDRGVIAIKPSGVSYELMRPEDMVVLDIEGKVILGTMRPSSDTQTHLVLYRTFPEIGGIAHTHSTYAVAWAQAGRPIPVYGTTHADHLHVDIPCTPFMAEQAIQGQYEIETGNLIVEKMRDNSVSQVEMILVAGHGPFTWGTTPQKAVYNSVVLEQVAKMAMLTEKINPKVQRLGETLIQKHFFRKHGPNAYYGQKD